jgi:hypothetical protein
MAVALAIANVMLAMVVAIYSLAYLVKHGGDWRWIKALTGIVGLYWAGVYLFILIADANAYNSPMFSQTIIRPGFTFTLSVLAIGAIWRWRTTQ